MKYVKQIVVSFLVLMIAHSSYAQIAFDDCTIECQQELVGTCTMLNAIFTKECAELELVKEIQNNLGDIQDSDIEVPFPTLAPDPLDPLDFINAKDDCDFIEWLKLIYAMLLQANNRVFGTDEIASGI